MQLSRWSDVDGAFIATGESKETLPPGIYDIAVVQGAVLFSPVWGRDDDLLRFPGTNTTSVVEEIETFWTHEASFRDHGLPYKRGILLYGPPGSGKSCTLRLIAEDVVARGGVVLVYSSPGVFLVGYRVFRMVQPETPIVVLMEDLDTILESNPETKILNLLDGVELVDKVVFLATTNFPERLGERIINRPSRFDRRFKIAHPNREARRMYLGSLVREGDAVDLDAWAKDTEGMSLAHLKELFVGTTILGSPYDATLKALKGMREKASSVNDSEEFEGGSFGGQYA